MAFWRTFFLLKPHLQGYSEYHTDTTVVYCTLLVPLILQEIGIFSYINLVKWRFQGFCFGVAHVFACNFALIWWNVWLGHIQCIHSSFSATRRRPIKGAAGRPVQYVLPDSPISPTTLQRREVERQLVPIHIQIKVFLVVVILLYLIYVVVEESSLDSVMSLLESPNQASDMESYAQETIAVSEQE